ncbi:hypothetical protein [Streptacidiphilus sp. EB129]|uniref:hypothetical protein n=1 Tax=Streptacidiphilus sp. EB129 TaxID=3156262 RepID=UPI003511BBB2
MTEYDRTAHNRNEPDRDVPEQRPTPGHAIAVGVGAAVLRGLAQGVSRLREKNQELTDVWSALRERRPPTIDTLTYEQVVAFFVSERPPTPDVRAGAAVRRVEDGQQVVHLVFLDTRGRPMLGGLHGPAAPSRSYQVIRMDDELADAFGDKDVLLFG